jgi:fluoride exporter
MTKWAYLIAGGVAGTAARYVLSGLVYEAAGTNFPYGTFVVNLVGCFLIGLFSVLADEKFVLGPQIKILLMAGFCGAFTTFSTFMLETGNLIKDGETARALANVLLSVTVGFVAFRVGILLGELI